MKDYVIWLGEQLSKKYPEKTWEQIMEIVTTAPEKEFEKRYGLYLSDYLKARSK